MNLKHIFMSSVAGSALLAGSLLAQAAPQSINPHTHSNLAAAQQLVDQAYQRITMAQQANKFDMQGHATKAKDLLKEASNELKAAAMTANGRPGHPEAGRHDMGSAPADNTSGARNPNLHEAQRLLDQAFSKISAAQAANEFDMQGHAAKAKDLLDRASQEVKLAAQAADNHRK